MQSVPGGNVNILGGQIIGRSKKNFMYTCFLFRTVCEVELLHCTGVWIWRPIFSFPPAILRPIRFLLMRLDEEGSLQNKSGYRRRTARSHNGCYRQHTGTSRCTQTSKTPLPHTSWKVHWCWRRNIRKCILLGKLYQLCHLKNKHRY